MGGPPGPVVASQDMPTYRVTAFSCVADLCHTEVLLTKVHKLLITSCSRYAGVGKWR